MGPAASALDRAFPPHRLRASARARPPEARSNHLQTSKVRQNQRVNSHGECAWVFGSYAGSDKYSRDLLKLCQWSGVRSGIAKLRPLGTVSHITFQARFD